MSNLLERSRDLLGRFLPISAVTEPVVNTEVTTEVTDEKEPVLVTQIQSEIFINGEPIDLTDIQRDQTLVLFHFGILRKEHFVAMCQLEGWRWEEDAEYEEDYDDQDSDY